MLARAETGSGALDWFGVPLLDLAEWIDTVNEIEKEQKRRKKR